MKIIMETERLILRECTLEDVGAVHQIYGDPKIMEFSLKGTQSPEQVQKMLERIISEYATEGFGNWAVLEKESGQLIGICGLRRQVVDDIAQPEISYRFNANHHGKGYATEAVRAVRDFAFNSLSMDRVISIIEPQNLASVRVACKNGMQLTRETTFCGVSVGIFSVEANALKK